MHLGLVLLRGFQSFLQIRTKTTGYGKTHYEVLGVAINATQDDIKTAYYELAKKYHPDKNSSKSSNQFMDISLAYEVLANHRTKKTYDEKLFKFGFVGDGLSVPGRKVMYAEQFRKSKTNRYRSIYDFDEWRQKHYSKTFFRRNEGKYRCREHLSMNATSLRETQIIRVIVFVIGFPVASYMWFKHVYENNDRPGKVK